MGTTRRPTAIDLFSGAGGLTEGLRQAGYSVVGAVEIDLLAAKAYRMNHPTVNLWEQDILKLSGQEILRVLGLRRGQLDLLAACPPCQGFSAMRTRNGKNRNRDPRKSLILEVLRLARWIRPKSIMVENVPGISTYFKFEEFKRGLQAMGYQTEWEIHNTADYGVPQRRRRLILLASLVGKPEFARPAARRTVRDAIGGRAVTGLGNDPLHNYTVEHSEKIQQLIKLIPKDGGSRISLGPKHQLRCHKKADGFKDVYGRMAWKRPAPTITGGCINPSKGRFLHPAKDRAITLREAALLQTFPRRYKFPLDRGRHSAALLIGNALPPEFIKRHAKALRTSVE